MEIAGLAPPVVHSTIAQALYATRLFNVTITNVPGPQQTLYAFGAPLREVHPLVPLAAEHAVGVAIVSYDGNAFFGVVADRDTVADLDVMLEEMRSGVGELRPPASASEDARSVLRRAHPQPGGPEQAAADARLSALDASFLEVEDAVSHMHIASVALFEGPRLEPPELRGRSPAKLPLVPRYRQVVRFVPFSTGGPCGSTTPTSTSSTTCATAPSPRPATRSSCA